MEQNHTFATAPAQKKTIHFKWSKVTEKKLFTSFSVQSKSPIHSVTKT